MRTLNLKLLLWLVGIGAFLAVAVWLTHRWQVNRNAHIYLDQARRFAKEKEPFQAALNYQRYLIHRPNDPEAVKGFTMAIVDYAETPEATGDDRQRAYDQLYKALRDQPNLDDVRRRLASFLIKMRRFTEAIEEYQKLIEKNPADRTELEVAMGLCHERNGEPDKAQAVYEQVIARDPLHVDAYVRLAELLRDRQEKPADADQVIAQLIEKNPDNHRAHMELARYLVVKRSRTSAEADRQMLEQQINQHMARALELGPDDVDVRLLAAALAEDNKDPKLARSHLEHAAAKHPGHLETERRLASLDWVQNKREDTIARLKKLAEKHPTEGVVLWTLTDFQLQNKDVAGARASLEQLRRDKLLSQVQLDYLEGRVLFQEMKHAEAIKHFEAVRPAMQREPQFMLEIDVYLSRCYASMGQVDKQLECLNRALLLDPRSVAVHHELGMALARQGQVAEALRELEPLVDVMPNVAETVVRLQLRRLAETPESERDYRSIEGLLTRLESQSAAGANTPVSAESIQLYRASVLAAEGKKDEALAMVRKARDQNPEAPAPWLSLINLTFRFEGPPAALRVTEEALAKYPQSIPLWGARIDLLGSAADDAAKQALAAEIERIAGSAADTHAFRYDTLGAALARVGDFAHARDCWQRLAVERPTDPQIRLKLFALALEAQNDQSAEAEIAMLAKMTGAESPITRYAQAARIVASARRDPEQAKRLPEARELLASAQQQRPTWHLVYSLQGDLETISGNREAAIEKYQEAVRFGERSPEPVRRLVQLLSSAQRWAEAKDAMRVLRIAASDSTDVKKIDVLVEQNTGRPEEALQKADKVLKDSTNPGELIWYGQLLAANQRNDEAGEAFRKAILLDDKNPDAWVALIGLLATTGKASEAESEINRARQALPAEQAPRALSRCYELLGTPDRAEPYYLEMLQAAPDDLSAMRNVASFYIRHRNNDAAMRYLQQIVDRSATASEAQRADIGWARRQVALIVAGRGGFRQLQDAITLLDKNAVDGQLGFDDLVLKSQLFARRSDRKSRAEAIALMEKAQGLRPLRPEEQLSLAELYDRNDQWDQARETMLNLLAKAPDNPLFQRAFIKMLMNRQEFGEAEPRIESLERTESGSVLAAEAKADLLAHRGQVAEAVALLEGLIPRPLPPQQRPVLRTVAGLILDLRRLTDESAEPALNASAEKLLREFVADEPDASLVLANFLGEHASLAEALELCTAAHDKPEQQRIAVEVALSSIRGRQAETTPEQFQKVEGWIEAIRKQSPDDALGDFLLADLRDIQGRYDDAQALYRKILERKQLADDQRIASLNNLAFLLAVKDGKGKEALPLIEQAIEIAGPLAELLDTRGMVCLAAGNVRQALTDLEDSIADSREAMKYFHLALANQQANDPKRAAVAFEEARKLGLRDEEVTDLEKERLQKLKTAIESLN